MGSFWQTRREVTSELIAAALFLGAAAVISCAFPSLPTDPAPGSMSVWDRPIEIAARMSVLAFLIACVLLFFRPRSGYVLGLFAGLIPLPWLVRTELALTPWNSWIFLNYVSPIPSDEGVVFAFANLKLLSVALAVVAALCSSLRLLPVRFSLRKSPLCLRTWPAVAVGFIAMAVWFVHSVSPYSVPRFDHEVAAELRILHVQKRGLRFHETTLSEYRDGRVWVWRNDRRLFQYQFEQHIVQISLGDASQATYERVGKVVRSAELWKLHTPQPKALRSWDAEGWYVVLKDTRLLAFTSEYLTAPPDEVIDLFHEIEKLAASNTTRFTVRDVCLGFCYDPVAALGFSVLQQRKRLLSRSAANSVGGF